MNILLFILNAEKNIKSVLNKGTNYCKTTREFLKHALLIVFLDFSVTDKTKIENIEAKVKKRDTKNENEC